MKYTVVLLFLFQYALYSQNEYVLHVEKNYVACYESNVVSENEVSINLTKNEHNKIVFLGGRKIIGKVSLTDFEKNKDSIVDVYQKKLQFYGYADNSVTYEYYTSHFGKDSSFVLFYIYDSEISSNLPFGSNGYGVYVRDGIYTVEIYNGKEFIQSFFVVIESNKVKKYTIDYKL